jgi:hypothetical protein
MIKSRCAGLKWEVQGNSILHLSEQIQRQVKDPMGKGWHLSWKQMMEPLGLCGTENDGNFYFAQMLVIHCIRVKIETI